jgi:cell division septation protein DedD
LVVFTAALSLVSALGVAYLSYQTKNVETDVKREEIAFEQAKFDTEQKNRDAENLKAIVPKIVSKDEQEVKVGMTTLFVLYQSRAKDILETVNSALTEQQRAALKDQIQPALARAQQLETLNDTWIIVVGGDRSLDEAADEVSRAQRAGYTPTLYLKQGWYRTTVGPFPTKSDADRTNIAVSATLRNGAYVVNLKSWCPQPSPKDKYVECTGQ